MEIKWRGATAVYTEHERADLAGLPSGEVEVIHLLKSLFTASPIPDGSKLDAVVTGAAIDRRAQRLGGISAHTFTLVAAQRAPDELLDAVESFIDAQLKLPYRIRFVLGDTSNLEKVAAQRAEDQNFGVTIVAKSDKGQWDEGADIRDERVVAQADAVYAFDSSARSKHYEQLCKRQRKPFHRV